MLSNFNEEFERNKRLVREPEINEFPIIILNLLKHSDIFKVDAGEEYNIDKLCVKGMEDLTSMLYRMDSPDNSIFQLTASDYCEVKTIKYIVENIDAFWSFIYGLDKGQRRILTKPAAYYAYHGNTMEDIYSAARDLYSTCGIRFSREEADKFINGTLTEKEILSIKRRTLNYLKPNYPLCRKKIIDSRVRIIINGAKFLDRYGYMEYYINANNNRARRLNMPYLQTNTRTSKKEKPFTCVSDYYDSDILSSLPDEELSALSLFMINRVEKVKSKVIKALAMITFLSNKTKNDIDDARVINVNDIPRDEIVEAITRYRVLNGYLKEQRQVLKEENKNNNKDAGYVNNSSLGVREANIASGISQEFLDGYNGEYNRYDKDNMLYEDLVRLVSADNFQIFYEYKDSLIDILLNSVISARININWGIQPSDEFGFVDENNQIILSFDLPGYNAPISCHANLDKVIKTIVNLTGDSIIPLYLGGGQLVYESNFTDRHYSTYIPFKLSREQKEALKTDSMNGTNSIAKHIAMMQNVLSTAKLKREENRFVDLLSFTEETKINPSVKSHK